MCSSDLPALSGDTRVTTTIDRLIPLTAPGRRRRDTIGGSLQDPTDPVGRLLFNVVAMIAEFSDRIGTRPGAHTGAGPAELFAVACSTACRGVQRAGAPTAPAAARTSAAGG